MPLAFIQYGVEINPPFLVKYEIIKKENYLIYYILSYLRVLTVKKKISVAHWEAYEQVPDSILGKTKLGNYFSKLVLVLI